jgi:alkylation response protein AidB-like acyl-CoA dehydrogenase
MRFGAQAQLVIGTDGDRVWAVDPSTAAVESLPGSAGYPMGTVIGGVRQPLDVAPEILLSWWRVALAAEMVGAMDAALAITVEHLSERHQFGRPLASFQALRHRLAEIHVSVEGARWLTRAAAFDGADPAAAAAAMVTAASAAELVIDETHQMSGAMGLTLEYDLHLWTRRLLALRLECGGDERHAQELARALWTRPALQAVRP